MLNLDKSINPLVSIIIINYNGLTYLDNILSKCLESVLTINYPNFEILFIDNGSTDNSIKYVENYFKNNTRIKIISLDKNYGTARAKNIGIMKSGGALILFLNNDIILKKHVLAKMVDTMRNNPKVGILGCKLILPSKEIQTEGELFLNNSSLILDRISPKMWRRKIKSNIKKRRNLNIVDWVTGAVVLIKKDILLSLKGYDENYYMFWEETDFAFRAKKAGYEVACLTNSDALHHHHMTAKHFSKWQRNISARNELLFIFKNYSNRMFIKAIIGYFISIFVIFIWSLITLSKYNLSIVVSLIKAFKYMREPGLPPD